jgi:hypothetical protein
VENKIEDEEVIRSPLPLRGERGINNGPVGGALERPISTLLAAVNSG